MLSTNSVSTVTSCQALSGGRQGLVRNNNGKEAHEGERFNNNTEYTFTAQEYFLNSGQNIREIMRSLKKLLRSSKMLLWNKVTQSHCFYCIQTDCSLLSKAQSEPGKTQIEKKVLWIFSRGAINIGGGRKRDKRVGRGVRRREGQMLEVEAEKQEEFLESLNKRRIKSWANGGREYEGHPGLAIVPAPLLQRWTSRHKFKCHFQVSHS